MSIGSGPEGEIFVPFRELLPMVHPNDIIFDGNDKTHIFILSFIIQENLTVKKGNSQLQFKWA